MELHIRRAGIEDAPAIARIVRALGWFAYLNSETEAQTTDRVANHLGLCRADASHSVYVAESHAAEVVGYAAVHWLPYLCFLGPEGYVSELIIQAEQRGQGIGTQLLAAIKREAIERGCSRLMLINKRNRESYLREFYAKQGWIERPAAASFVLPLK
jgi:GNAT superfamily N-acetyltransferase